MSEGFDGGIVIEHHETNTRGWELMNGMTEGVLSLEFSGQFTGPVHKEVSAVILISKSMSADNDGFGPVVDQSGDVFD